MLEEITKEELESMSKKINSRLNSPWRQEAANIITRQGKIENIGETHLPGEYYIENGKKGLRFYNNYTDVLSRSDIGVIIDVLKKEGYEVKDNKGNFL
ncbi:MAG: hypothetical protein ACP5NZ_00645 [Nanobdellota archaeon]